MSPSRSAVSNTRGICLKQRLKSTELDTDLFFPINYSTKYEFFKKVGSLFEMDAARPQLLSCIYFFRALALPWVPCLLEHQVGHGRLHQKPGGVYLFSSQLTKLTGAVSHKVQCEF